MYSDSGFKPTVYRDRDSDMNYGIEYAALLWGLQAFQKISLNGTLFIGMKWMVEEDLAL